MIKRPHYKRCCQCWHVEGHKSGVVKTRINLCTLARWLQWKWTTHACVAMECLLADTQMAKRASVWRRWTVARSLMLWCTKMDTCWDQTDRRKQAWTNWDNWGGKSDREVILSLTPHLLGHLGQQQCLPGAGSSVHHQRAHPAPFRWHEVLLYVIQSLWLVLIEGCVGLTEGQVL